MKHPILLALFCLGIVLLTAFYFISKTLYKQRHNENYSFVRMFPYEYNYPSVFKENIWGNVLFLFACSAVVVFYIMNPFDSIYKNISSVTKNNCPDLDILSLKYFIAVIKEGIQK